MNKLTVVAGVAVWLAVMPVWAADEAPGKVVEAPGKEVVETAAQKAEKFQSHKAMQVKGLEARLACVKAANSPADIKNCHEAQKARQQEEKLQRIQEQRKKLDEREKMLKEQHKKPVATP